MEFIGKIGDPMESEQEKTGVRVGWCYFCSCHGKCDCDPEARGGAAKHAVAQQQLRDNMDERTRISTYEDLTRIQFLMAEFQTPTKGIYQKKGRSKIWGLHRLYEPLKFG